MVKPIKHGSKNLKIKHVPLLSLMLTLLIGLSTVSFLSPQPISSSPIDPPVYVGVSFCGNTTEAAKMLIDKTKAYTNLFVLQSGPISIDMKSTTEICDYAVSQGLNVIVYFGWFNPEHSWQVPWVKNAQLRYGEKFLGVYYYDEPSGIQLDYDWAGHFTNVTQRLANMTVTRNVTSYYRQFIDAMYGYLNGSIVDYDTEANAYVDYMLHDRDLTLLRNISMRTFVSDYALYWWDYLGGFDVVLTQLGNNATLEQEIALTRGAATLQKKTWGGIITWKYDEPPYLDSGKEIYKQMHMAYQAGAKYVIIFDYPQIDYNPYGVLTEEHFDAMEQFWHDIMLTPNSAKPQTKASAVLVLPKNYGWGMRHAQDRIWLWGPDELSPQIWDISRKLLAQYGTNLDIVYEDPNFPINGKYDNIYYWNQTLT